MHPTAVVEFDFDAIGRVDCVRLAVMTARPVNGTPRFSSSLLTMADGRFVLLGELARSGAAREFVNCFLGEILPPADVDRLEPTLFAPSPRRAMSHANPFQPFVQADNRSRTKGTICCISTPLIISQSIDSKLVSASWRDLQFSGFLGHMRPMPKKRKVKNNLTRIREGMDLSIPDFARRLGVSASIIKKLEAGNRTLSQDLSARIFAETGIMLFSAPEEEPLEYTKEMHREWKKEVLFDPKSIKIAERIIMKLVELMMAASVRPGVEKSYVVFSELIQAIERVKNEFRMEKHIDAKLRDRQATEMKLYTVRELRHNSLWAQQVGFKDDPKLKDDEQLPLAKTVGWLPAKEIFSIRWQHQEFVKQILGLDENELTDAQKARLADIEKQQAAAIDSFIPQ